MIFMRLLPLALLAGCVSHSAAITRVVTITPVVPATMLNCAAAPTVPGAASQAVVADYLVALWQAGQDCRVHLGAVRTVLAK